MKPLQQLKVAKHFYPSNVKLYTNMPRRSTKKFDFGKGIYYFNINKGYNNVITIKRKDKDKAIIAFSAYQKNQNAEWLGKWDGKKFVDANFAALAKAQ